MAILHDFNFTAKQKLGGKTITISFIAPDILDVPDWNGYIKILRKQGEWPTAHNDSGAHISLNSDFSSSIGLWETDETNLVPNQIYYYSLYAQKTDSTWVHDRFLDRGSAYPYGQWGTGLYLLNSLPRGWRSSDNGDLESFLNIFGAIFDSLKTDAEQVLTLFEINSIHEDLIPYLDQKIGWPTWHSTNGLQKRKETSEAVTLYTSIGIGRASAYEQILENTTDWDASIKEGWRYVMFSNGKYDSTTPDLSTTAKQDEIKYNLGRETDLLKYTNDTQGWHSLSGLGFFLTEIPGVSGEFSSDIIERILQMIEFIKATYVTTYLIINPIDGETFGLPTEDWYQEINYV